MSSQKIEADGRRNPAMQQLTADVLSKLYCEERWSQRKIAESFGVSQKTLGRQFAAFGRQKRSIKEASALTNTKSKPALLTPEFLRRHYVELGFSETQLALFSGTSRHTIRRALVDAGITVLGPAESLRRTLGIPIDNQLSDERLVSLYTREHLSLTAISQKFHVTRRDLKARLKACGVKIRSAAVAGPLVSSDNSLRKFKKHFFEKRYLDLGRSAQAIATELKTSPWLVRKRLRELKIPLRSKHEALTQSKTEKTKTISKELLAEFYVKQRNSCAVLGKALGVWPSTISHYLRKFELPVRTSAADLQVREPDDPSSVWLKACAPIRYGAEGEISVADKRLQNPIVELIEQEQLQALQRALSTLDRDSPRLMQIARMSFGLDREPMSCSEIACRLGLPERDVRADLEAALKALAIHIR